MTCARLAVHASVLALAVYVTAAAAAQSCPNGAQATRAVLPRNGEDRAAMLRSVAFDATIYGLPAYLQYKEMHRQALDRSAPGYTGFNRFAHERQLAGPGYVAFKVPNSDTLYSTAWLDLTGGPLEVSIPATSLKYYTLNLFDIYGNPSNLGTRTIGSQGGRFLLVPPGWSNMVPAGLKRFDVATPQMWVLMRVFAQTPAELEQAHRFQDAVRLVPRPDLAVPSRALADPPAPGSTASDFMRVLDYVLYTNGNPAGENALVEWFGSIEGLGSGCFDPSRLDAESVSAIAMGHQQAMEAVDHARSQLGQPTGTGWMRVAKGNYGYGFFRRAINNLAGLGANVPEENASFNTFADAGGVPLDGTKGRYRLRLTQPPPVNAFWSVTLYDARTFELYPNPLKRYLISDRTKGLKVAPDGSIEIAIQHDRPRSGNWLPAPNGPFFLVLRQYLPKPEALSGAWLPPGVNRLANQQPGAAIAP